MPIKTSRDMLENIHAAVEAAKRYTITTRAQERSITRLTCYLEQARTLAELIAEDVIDSPGVWRKIYDAMADLEARAEARFKILTTDVENGY